MRLANMQSKVALKELKENAQEICKWELDRLNIIEKDLEILEIIKKYLYHSEDSTLYIAIELMTKKEYKIYKDWLDNKE